jgi:hypothetical protein
MKRRAWLIVDGSGQPVLGIRNVWPTEERAIHLLKAWADQNMIWTPVEIEWKWKPKRKGAAK